MLAERGREDMMNAMVRVGLGIGMAALLATAVGCSGGGSSGAFLAKAPSSGGEVTVDFQTAPSQAGNAPSGGAPAADMSSTSPPPAPSAVGSTAQMEEGASR